VVVYVLGALLQAASELFLHGIHAITFLHGVLR
jgi:hypothetical protein